MDLADLLTEPPIQPGTEALFEELEKHSLAIDLSKDEARAFTLERWWLLVVATSDLWRRRWNGLTFPEWLELLVHMAPGRYVEPPLPDFPKLVTSDPYFVPTSPDDPECYLDVMADRAAMGRALKHPGDTPVEATLGFGMAIHALGNGEDVRGALVRLIGNANEDLDQVLADRVRVDREEWAEKPWWSRERALLDEAMDRERREAA